MNREQIIETLAWGIIDGGDPRQVSPKLIATTALAALETAGLCLVPIDAIRRLDAEAVLISPHDEAVKREVLDELRAYAPAIASQEDGK